MPATWVDITAHSGHPGDRLGSVWMLSAGPLTIIVEPYRTGAPGGPFRRKGPWRLQYSVVAADVPLTATTAADAKDEAPGLVRAVLEAALAALPPPGGLSRS